MIGPRHMGSSPTVKRQLSRLSSSSSFQVRQSNSRIYTFLVAGGLLLLATVALLQFHLQGAPQSSKLSPRENGKPVESIAPAQSWWNGNNGGVHDGATKERANKFGRKMGSVQQVDEEEESNDDGIDVEMEDDEEDSDDDEQALFDIDVDDRIAEDSEDEEISSMDSLVNSTKNGSLSDGSKQDDDHKTVPNWVLDVKLGSDAQILGVERQLVKGLEEKKESDHGLGIKTRFLENVEEEAAKVGEKKGFKDFVESWKERFSSDDELVDENVQQRLESVREIEDALLLNGVGEKSKWGVLLKKGMNPTISNPMLQDPDTPPGTWMTKTDKQMLRAFRGGQPAKASLLRGNNVLDSVVHREASTR